MNLRQVTVGVVGDGAVSHELVCDALNEHFAFGPADAEGYFGKSAEFEVRALIPAGEERFSSGIEAMWQWAVRAEIAFLVYCDATSTPWEEQIRSTLLDVADFKRVPSPETAILNELLRSRNPMLLVLPKDGEYSPALQGTAAAALVRSLPVYDLSRGLLEQTWKDIGVDEESARNATKGVQLAAEEARHYADTIARAYSLVSELRQLSQQFADLQPAVAGVERALRLPEPLEAPEVSPQAAPEPEPASDKPARTRLEVWDEKSGEWRAAGRGRPKQGLKTRRVPK